MTEETENTVNDGVYDSPIILPGKFSIEPQRYVAERPYDLTRYEYSFLKRNYSGGFWSNLFAGATAGLVISVLGKTVISLFAKETPELQPWEVVGIAIGVVLTLLFKYCIKSDDDKKKQDLISVVEIHFKNSKPRRVHLTGQESNDET
jgi:tetrahydromethanopterin S-methyltransferase subunit F